MQSARTVVVALVVAMSVAACGDDGGGGGADGGGFLDGASLRDGDVMAVDGTTAGGATLAGDFRMVSMTVDTGSGALTTSANDDPPTLVGAARFTATGDDTLDMHVTFDFLPSGVPGGLPEVDDLSVVVEDETHLAIGSTGDFAYYVYAVTDEGLTLTQDAEDPRNGSSEAPVAIDLARIDPGASMVIGTWNVTTVTIAGPRVVTPETCTENRSGQWQKYTMSFELSGLFEAITLNRIENFSDDTCSTSTGMQQDRMLGFVHEDGDTMTWWAVNEGDPEASGMRLSFSLTRSADVLSLTRTGCLPVGDCEGDGPAAIEMRLR